MKMDGKVYEIVNPSDAYTFRADEDKIALAAGIVLGEGKYDVERCEDGESLGALLFLLGEEKLKEELARLFDGVELGKFLTDNIEKIADALESVLCMKAGERFTYERAFQLIPSEEDKKAFRDEVHDRQRSSMNDIGARAWALAEAYREKIEEDKKWIEEGGRPCPAGIPAAYKLFKEKETGLVAKHLIECSQPVFKKKEGDYDYGEVDGPGYNSCLKNCEWMPLILQITFIALALWARKERKS